MELARTRAEVRAALTPARAAGRRVGFVATMGAFHEGHLSLMRAARRAYDVAVVSIFVNPLQFGEENDYAFYPRDEQRDLRLAEPEGVDLVFAPGVEEMYPRGHATRVDPGPLATVLEGASRPGHFAGVATVVTKLFNLVQPQGAFFGQKDAQQVAVVRRVVEDLLVDVRVEVCDTVREPDGLALSSRNVLLSADERERAVVLSRATLAGRRALEQGHRPRAAEEAMIATVRRVQGVDLDYARVVDAATFGEPVAGRDILLLIAARIGKVRLIDNLPWAPCS